MQNDNTGQFRNLFREHFNDFSDRVDTPWDHSIPDLPEFNGRAYNIISRQLDALQRDRRHASRGILILGAAGTGKTHLLMRIVQKLAMIHTKANIYKLKSHILFVRRPNNEEAVAQHIWDNIITSLNQSLTEE